MGKPYSPPEHHTGHNPDSGDVAPISRALEMAKAALVEVGEDRIELVTATSTGRVTIQPAHLADGEAIARALGLGLPLDQRMLVPGHTLWSGTRDGFEFQVRGALRQPHMDIQ